MLNISIFEDDCIKSDVVTGNNFYVGEEELNDYITFKDNYYNVTFEENDADYNEIIKKLDSKYKINNNVYLINDVYLSRNRVIRNLSKYSSKLCYEELIYYSIVKDSILDDASFDKVKEELNSKILKKIKY